MGRDGKYKNSAFWQLLVPPGLRWMGTRLWNVLLYSEGFLKMDTDYFRNVLRHNIGSFTFQEVREKRMIEVVCLVYLFADGWEALPATKFEICREAVWFSSGCFRASLAF